ncbi:hypothetical protein AB0J86_12165 [Micromonospora sp. NPDC049559]
MFGPPPAQQWFRDALANDDDPEWDDTEHRSLPSETELVSEGVRTTY